MIEVWHIWVIVALVFFIAEIFTSGFAVCCFSFGAIAAAICSACGMTLLWQSILFAVVTMVAFVTIRPLVLKFFFKAHPEQKTNADAVIGREGRISEAIDPVACRGRVAIDGDDWKAVSADGVPLEKGAVVEVVSRDGVTLTVKTK